jgi:hypothetical protein
MVVVLEARALLASPTITTVAGTGMIGYSGDGGPATGAEFRAPWGVAVDAHGNLFIGDGGNSVVREVNASTGVITTVVGTGTPGYSGDDGPATRAQLWGPEYLAFDAHGNLFIADSGDRVVREVSASTGVITTVAGTGEAGYTGDGGPATGATLGTSVSGVAVDAHGNLFIADFGNSVIREVSASTGVITTVAGTGKWGDTGDGGPATSATLIHPTGVAVDAHGNLFIVDGNSVVREVNASTGVIATVAGTGGPGYSGDGGPATHAALDPINVLVDAQGNLFIADNGNAAIREVNASTGVITTVAGTGTPGYTGDGGPAISAKLWAPSSLALDVHGNLFIADAYNNVIREVSGVDAPTPTPTPTTPTPTPSPTPPPGPAPPVTLRSVSLKKVRTGEGSTTEVIDLHFSGAIDPADADHLGAFSLTTIPKKKRQKSKPVALAGASYQPTDFTLLLTPRKRLVLNPPIRLTVFAAGLLDAEGRPMAGDDTVTVVLSPSGARVMSAVPLIGARLS